MSASENDLERADGSCDGTWFLHPSGEPIPGPHPTDFCVCIAEADNPRYREARARLYRENRVALAMGGETADTLRKELEVRAQAETILLDWRNLIRPDGSQIPYTLEQGIEKLGQRRFWKFAQFVVDVSNVPLFYERKVEADAVGN